MTVRVLLLLVPAVLAAGCASSPDVDLSRLATDPLAGDAMDVKSFDIMPADTKVVTMKNKLETMYSTVMRKVNVAKVTAYGEQRSRFTQRKRLGLLAILLSATAQTLTVKSQANLATVTALTALSGAATGYIANDDSTIDPMSSERVGAAMDRIDRNVADYYAQVELLTDAEKSSFTEWEHQYSRCVAALRMVELATHDILIPAGVGEWER